MMENEARPTSGTGPLRTAAEQAAAARLAELFVESGDDVETKLANFPKYVRRTHITRFLALYELFKLCLPVKGSIVECGVFRGFGLMTWANLSAVLEPTNLTRRIYGFDSFQGFPGVSADDHPDRTGVRLGDLHGSDPTELRRLLEVYDSDRFLGHIPKVHLIEGDVTETIPDFINQHPHLVVSLLFCDLDLYEPTLAALRHFLPRMPAGAVLAFDELDNPLWPGETSALMDEVGIRNVQLERLDFDPYIAFAILDR